MTPAARVALRTEQPPRCPDCGYDLRGLPPGRRCPECGTQADFYGPRKISRKQARRIDRRLLFPPLVVLFVLFSWGADLEHFAANVNQTKQARDAGTVGLLGGGGLGVLLWFDLRRSLRARRRLRRRGRVTAGSLTAYFWFQGVALALIVLWSAALLVGVVPPPRSESDPIYISMLLAVMVAEALALAAAAWQVPRLLQRRQRPAAGAFVLALVFAPAAALAAGGCCVFPYLMRPERDSAYLSLGIFWLGVLFVPYCWRRLRASVGIESAPPPPRPFLWPMAGRRRRPKRLVLHPGEARTKGGGPGR